MRVQVCFGPALVEQIRERNPPRLTDVACAVVSAALFCLCDRAVEGDVSIACEIMHDNGGACPRLIRGTCLSLVRLYACAGDFRWRAELFVCLACGGRMW